MWWEVCVGNGISMTRGARLACCEPKWPQRHAVIAADFPSCTAGCLQGNKNPNVRILSFYKSKPYTKCCGLLVFC